jgi:hypothetical protein
MDIQALPEIRIKDAWLLRENASVHLNMLWGNGEPLRSDDEYRKIADTYRAAWQPIGQTILSGLTDMLDLQFSQNKIDVYIAPWFSAFSDPMVIGVTSEPDHFIDYLTHELIHRLLTDNSLLDPEQFLVPEWERLYGSDHSLNSLIHIPVDAVHKAIYLDVLKAPERLERDQADCIKNNATDYIAAWDYVDRRDYHDLIAELKTSYQSLA